jgi:hypothetical protein
MSTPSTSSTTDKNTKAFPPRARVAAASQAIDHKAVATDTTKQAEAESNKPDENGEKEGFYKLQKPFTARKNNANTLFEYLPVPEVITTGTMRKVDATTDLHFAMQLTALCSSLDAAQMTKIHPTDIAGFTALMLPLIAPNDKPGFEIPKIKTFAALIPKITVNISRQIEFVAQVLQNCGMDADEINALDHRDFSPAIPLVVGALMDPKA